MNMLLDTGRTGFTYCSHNLSGVDIEHTQQWQMFSGQLGHPRGERVDGNDPSGLLQKMDPECTMLFTDKLVKNTFLKLNTYFIYADKNEYC